MRPFGRSSGILLATAAIAAAVQAQQPAMTVQQQFDAANAATASGDKAAALAAWSALERRVAGNRRSEALVRVRRSGALFALDRYDEAAAEARAGLAALPKTDASLAQDRFEAQFLLGRIAEGALDYASAADAFRAAETIATTPGDKVASALSLARTDTFVDPAAAQAALDRVDTILATTKSDAVVRGEVARAHDLLDLNEGRFADARKEAMKAVELFGGLTEKSDLNDVNARSDTAIAAMLAGDQETARKYMAYTGAGNIPDGGFNPAIEMAPPECGGEAGLKPDDMAVVQFSIGEDGAVRDVRPIYAAGGGAVALEFARAAERWSWHPEQVKALPRFFRYDARVEMRCSTGFARPSIGSAMREAVTRWLVDKDVLTVPVDPDKSAAAALPAERAAYARADGLSAVSTSVALLENPVLPAEDRHGVAVRALALAQANGAPPLAQLYFDLAVRASVRSEGRRDRDFKAELASLLTTPPYQGDPRARAAIRLFLAAGSGKHPDAASVAALHQVADDPALAQTDAMKIAALLQLSSIAQNAGDEAAARASFAQTGLAADQCALIDSPPKLLSAGGTFPQEAMRWGFEGWTRTQFDVAADGRVQNERVIVSYPPFIFTKAGAATIAGAHYTKSYRPDGALGCGGAMQQIRFKIPSKH